VTIFQDGDDMPRRTHTFVTLAISQEAYKEIKEKLLAAGYNHVFVYDFNDEETIDMQGIGLTEEREIQEYEPKSKYNQS
jgi:hypothetical protein